MKLRIHRNRWLIRASFGLAALTGAFLYAQPAPSLAEQEHFLLTGKIVSTKLIGQGVTKSSVATLAEGSRTHLAQIQSVDRALNELYAPDGSTVPWRDDWRHNVAAYLLDRYLNLDMIPPSVERMANGKPAAFTWWVDNVAMVETERQKKEVTPPDAEQWARQRAIGDTFDQLIYNVDRNSGNLVITKDWKLVLIDHTRAFAPNPRLMERDHFDRCSRTLFASLQALNAQALTAAVKGYLNKQQIAGMLVRRDMIVAHFKKLIAERGEAAVLFP